MGIKTLFLSYLIIDLLFNFKWFYFKLVEKYGGNVLRFHLGPRANAVIFTPEGFEKVLSSNKQITKVKIDIFLEKVVSCEGLG